MYDKDFGPHVEISEPDNKDPETLKINGSWNTLSKKLKTKFPQLTDADLEYIPGRENELLARIGITIGKKRDDLIDILKKSRTEKF